MTLSGRFLQRPGSASAPMVMMMPSVRVGMRMGAGAGRSCARTIGADAAQTENTAAGRLRSHGRHVLENRTKSRINENALYSEISGKQNACVRVGG